MDRLVPASAASAVKDATNSAEVEGLPAMHQPAPTALTAKGWADTASAPALVSASFANHGAPLGAAQELPFAPLIAPPTAHAATSLPAHVLPASPAPMKSASHQSLLLPGEFEKVKASFAGISNKGARDPDAIVSLDAILAGVLGPVEQQAAQELMQRELWPPAPGERELRITLDDEGEEEGMLLYEDDSGCDMRVEAPGDAQGANISKRRRSSHTDEEAPEKRRKGGGRWPGSGKYGDAPGPMPPGWVVVLRESAEESRKWYKRYRSPSGRVFQTFVQAQGYWEACGESVVHSVPHTVTPSALGAGTADELFVDPWELEDPLSSLTPEYLPASFMCEMTGTGDAAFVWRGQREGVAEERRFTSLPAAKRFARANNIGLAYLPPAFDFTVLLDWMAATAAAGNAAALPLHAEATAVEDAALRVSGVLTAMTKRRLAPALAAERTAAEQGAARRRGPAPAPAALPAGRGRNSRGVAGAAPQVDDKKDAVKKEVVKKEATSSEADAEEGTAEHVDEAAFLSALTAWFEAEGRAYKLPKLFGALLDPYKLWREVTDWGGYDKVCTHKKWASIARSIFDPPKSCTTVSYDVKQAYTRVLFNFEQAVRAKKAAIPLPKADKLAQWLGKP